jgi:hypothetical protein
MVVVPIFRRSLPIQNLSTLGADTDLAALRFLAVLDACGPAISTNQSDVGNVDGSLLLENAASDLLVGIRPRMPLDHVDMLHEEAGPPRFDIQHSPGLALIAAGQYLYFVVPANVEPSH